MVRKKRIGYTLAIIPLLIIIGFFGWFFFIVFEGEQPLLKLDPLPSYLSGEQGFTLRLEDAKRGLRRTTVTLAQGGREIVLLEEKFPFIGLLNRQGTHRFEKAFSIDTSGLNLAQGRVDLTVQVWDYAMRQGGDGNRALFKHTFTVDTIPPSLRALSRMHNLRMGGAGLVVYQTSSDALETGVFVDKIFYRGYPAGPDSPQGYHVCYIALPHNAPAKPSLSLWARDKAGNDTNTRFYYHVIRKRFRGDRINISDGFLSKVLPYFSSYTFAPGDTDLEKYIKVNNGLREKNHATIRKLSQDTVPERLWEGPFLRLKNAATMARYGDHRSYYYKGKKVDEQTHLGVDLASLAESEVQASNRGRVIFADTLGIYGLTVVLDHGQGIATLYGHLSKLEVNTGQEVEKGQPIGYTGRTGLAGGDHLHFSIMVQGVFVNPIEWWDNHWITDNISNKLSLLEKK